MTGLPPYLVAYDIMSILSALVIAATILTVICSHQLHRGKAWLGMMFCWLVYAISYGILVGRQIGPEPAFAHCFIQSILIYSAPPLASVGTLCFYLDFYLGSRWDSTHRKFLQPRVTTFMLVLPWIVHVLIVTEVIILTFRNKTGTAVRVGRVESSLYCHLHDNNIPVLVNAGIVVLSMVLLVPLEVWTGIQLYRNRAIHADANFRRYLVVYLRVAGCTLGALASFGLCVLSFANVKKKDVIVQDLSFPCLSMVVALIFASQQDLLNIWFCRRQRPFPSPSSELVQSVDHITPEEPKTLQHKSTWSSDLSNSIKLPLRPLSAPTSRL